MERKSTKTRLKNLSVASKELLNKLLTLPVFLLILHSGLCSSSTPDVHNSSNLVYSNYSTISLPATNHHGREKYRHANRRRMTFEIQSSKRLHFNDTHLTELHSQPSSNISRRDREEEHGGDKDVLRDIKFLRRHLNKGTVNFIMTDQLVDGEQEIRILFDGVLAKETHVGSNGNGLKLRQLSDGRHLVQMIYTPGGAVYDCEYITQGKSVRNFLKTLRREFKEALEEEKERIFNRMQSPTGDPNAAYVRHFENVTFKIFKDGERPPADVDWLDYERLKLQCLEKHEEIKYLLERKSSGSKVSKVGAESALTRFRACLKLADTSVSNMVGKLFFNIVQTKCFVLKPSKVCTQRSWWGKCLKRGYTKQAHLRDNLPY